MTPCPIDMFLISSKFLSSIGLIFDIIGVIIIFKFGLPESINRKGTLPFIPCDDVDIDEIKKAQQFDTKAKAGFVTTNDMGKSDTQFAIQSGSRAKDAIILGTYKDNTISRNKDLDSNFTRNHVGHFLIDNRMLTETTCLSLMTKSGL